MSVIVLMVLQWTQHVARSMEKSSSPMQKQRKLKNGDTVEELEKSVTLVIKTKASQSGN